jgi:hypothetical protein
MQAGQPHRERAPRRATDLAPTIAELRAAGCESLRAIAAGLEERGIPAARGGKWSAVQVSRLLRAAGSPFEGASVGAGWDASDSLSALVQQGIRCRIPIKPERSGTIGERSSRTLAGAKRARSANAYAAAELS